jgi:osmotically-inducible protein OsmY
MAPLVEEIVKQKIVEQLMWDDSVNANDVHVDIIDNTARLTGTVPNYTAKLAAERNAYMVEGVNFVENLLEVKFPPTITVPADSDIKNSIKNILSWYNEFTGEINAEVNDNVVTLSGMVDNYREKVRAEEIANSVRGVIDVKNNIQIRNVKDIHDAEIESDVRKAINRNKLVDESDVTVTVDQGVALLRGTVTSEMLKKEANNIALYTKGVKSVINEIVVL